MTILDSVRKPLSLPAPRPRALRFSGILTALLVTVVTTSDVGAAMTIDTGASWNGGSG